MKLNWDKLRGALNRREIVEEDIFEKAKTQIQVCFITFYVIIWNNASRLLFFNLSLLRFSPLYIFELFVT